MLPEDSLGIPIIDYLRDVHQVHRLFSMTKLYQFTISLLLLGTSVCGQSVEEKLTEIQGQWQTNKEGFPQFRRTYGWPLAT